MEEEQPYPTSLTNKSSKNQCYLKVTLKLLLLGFWLIGKYVILEAGL